MRYLNLPLLFAVLLGTGIAFAQDKAEKAPRSETTLEREARILNQQKADEKRSFYIQIIVIAAIAVPVVLFTIIFLTRRAPDLARHMVEVASLEARSKWSSRSDFSLSDCSVAEVPRSHHGHESRLVEVPKTESSPGTHHGGELAYILVRFTGSSFVQRLARIYVLKDELLITDIGECDNLNEAVFAGGGLSGSGFILEKDPAINGEGFQRARVRLDPLGPYEAPKLTDFRLQFSDISDISLDPSSGLEHLQVNSRAVGTLRLKHRKQDNYSFDIFSLVEVRGAIRLLTPALGKAVHIAKDWDEMMPSYLSSL
jgi:hypothetical protein